MINPSKRPLGALFLIGALHVENLLTLTPFIRAIKDQPLGFSSVYMVPQGDDYASTQNKLIAVAGREGFKISTAQLYVVDSSSLKTVQAIKVTRK